MEKCWRGQRESMQSQRTNQTEEQIAEVRTRQYKKKRYENKSNRRTDGGSQDYRLFKKNIYENKANRRTDGEILES